MSFHFILILNRQGKSRLVKWFDNRYTVQERQKHISQIHRLISTRDQKHQSNFVDYHQNKLVYRRYAGLYFVASIDLFDNELSCLESLHFFVEVLDAYFNDVCELDLVFNFNKVYLILDEIYIGGEVQEILKRKILDRLTHIDRSE